MPWCVPDDENIIWYNMCPEKMMMTYMPVYVCWNLMKTSISGMICCNMCLKSRNMSWYSSGAWKNDIFYNQCYYPWKSSIIARNGRKWTKIGKSSKSAKMTKIAEKWSKWAIFAWFWRIFELYTPIWRVFFVFLKMKLEKSNINDISMKNRFITYIPLGWGWKSDNWCHFDDNWR